MLAVPAPELLITIEVPVVGLDAACAAGWLGPACGSGAMLFPVHVLLAQSGFNEMQRVSDMFGSPRLRSSVNLELLRCSR